MLTVTHAIRARKDDAATLPSLLGFAALLSPAQETFEFVGREIPLNPRFGAGAQVGAHQVLRRVLSPPTTFFATLPDVGACAVQLLFW